jgi:hypothetical protein
MEAEYITAGRSAFRWGCNFCSVKGFSLLQNRSYTPSISIAATATVLQSERRAEALHVIGRALEKCPVQVLRANLGTVYLLGGVRYNGISASGTNSRRNLYIQIGAVERGFTPAHIERTFHAEFSSVLMRNWPHFLNRDAWKAANPVGFNYLGNGVEAVKMGKARTNIDERLHAQGFLSQYGQSTLENDFNGYAQSLWTGDAYLWDLTSKHVRLRAKLDLAITFCNKVHAKFEEKFFRSLVGATK